MSKWLKSPKKETEPIQIQAPIIPADNSSSDSSSIKLEQDHKKILNLLKELEDEPSRPETAGKPIELPIEDSISDFSIEELLNATVETPSMLFDDKQVEEEDVPIIRNLSKSRSVSATSIPSKSRDEFQLKPVTAASSGGLDNILQGFMQDADEYLSYLDTLKTKIEEPKESTIANNQYSLSFDSLSDPSSIEKQEQETKILPDSIVAQDSANNEANSEQQSSNLSQFESEVVDSEAVNSSSSLDQGPSQNIMTFDDFLANQPETKQQELKKQSSIPTLHKSGKSTEDNKEPRTKNRELDRVNSKMVPKSLSKSFSKESIKRADSQPIDVYASVSSVPSTRASVVVPMNEIDDVQNTLGNLRKQVNDFKKQMQKKDEKIEKLKSELETLEKIRQMEQFAAEESIRASTKSLPTKKSEKLAKEVADLERLVSGYQLENERLSLQVKNLQKQSSELSAKLVLKQENYQNELGQLKRQLSKDSTSDLVNVQWQVKAEQLEEQLQTTKNELGQVKQETKLKISALLKQIEQLEKSQPSESDHSIDHEERNKLQNLLDDAYVASSKLKTELQQRNSELNLVKSELEQAKQTISLLQKQAATSNAATVTPTKEPIATTTREPTIIREQVMIIDKARENELLSEISQLKQQLGTGDSLLIQQLNTRNLNLEKTVSEQSLYIQQTRVAHQEAEQELLTKLETIRLELLAKDRKIASLTEKLNEQSMLRDEREYIQQIETLKIDLSKALSDKTKLENQLLVSEATRKAIHENTLIIIKQAQEESAKIALQQHERALNVLRTQTQLSSQQMLDAEIARMVKVIKEADRENIALKEKLSQVESELQELENPEKENSSEHAGLKQKLRNLEQKFKSREEELRKILSEKSNSSKLEIERVDSNYKSILAKKNQQIEYFKGQLDSLMSDLKRMRH